jgi:hypothetical protein
MHRFCLRLALILLLIFSAVLLLNHMQSSNLQEIRDVLLPSASCPAPCFMGIRPSITTVDEALKILEASGWLAHYNYEEDGTAIRITWNDQRPAWLGNNKLYGQTYMWIKDGLVIQIFVETNLMLGAIHLSLGQPPLQQISLNYINSQYYLFYVAVYPDESINISTSRDCQHKERSINYLTKVFLNYPSSIGASAPPTYHRSWLDVLHTVCP